MVPPSASAQTFVGAAFQQAFTSTSSLASPRGLSLSVGVDRIWGPVGLSIGYQNVSQGFGVIAQTCGFASCMPGPFDQSRSLQTADLGISLHPVDGPLAIFTLGANVSVSSQVERLEHVETSEVRHQNRVGSDLGFGISTRLELPVVQKLHPFLSARYDRILASACDVDAPCLGSRNVTRLEMGLLLRL